MIIFMKNIRKNIFTSIFILGLINCTSGQKVEPEKPEPPAASKVDRKAIIKTITSHKKYMSHCYGQTLTKKGNATLKGVVYISFEVGPDGAAKNPKMIEEKSTLKSEELNNCLFAGITSWDFPVHSEGEPLEIQYPFRFKDTPPANMQKKLNQFEKLRRNP